MLFLLLFVGNSAAWADWYIAGEALPGLEEWVGKDWKVNALPLNTKLTDNTTYYYCFQNVSASNDNRYRLKITNGDWGTQRTADNTSEAKGNVDVVTGKSGDNQISFKMPFDGDVYVFFNDGASNNEKVWIVAVPTVAAIGNTTAQSKTMKFDLLIKDNGWNTTINFIKNNVDALTYKYVTSYVAPACTSGELSGTKPPKVRFEARDGSNSFDGKGDPYRAELATSVRRVIYLWNGNTGNAPQKYIIPSYPNRSSESGWKLWAYDGSQNISGDLSSGSVTVQIEGGKTVEYFITNSTSVTGPDKGNFTDKTRHSVNSFGGCYVDKTASSNVTFDPDYQIYTSNSGGVYKLGNIAKPIVAENDMRGSVTINGSGTKDVTFTFDGGVITINAVEHSGGEEPGGGGEPCETFTPGETIYFDLRNAAWYNDGVYFAAKCYNSNDEYLGDAYKVTLSETGTSHVYSFAIPNNNDIDRVEILRIHPQWGQWGYTAKMRAVDAGTNDCIYMPKWTDNPVSCNWTMFGSGLSSCGGGEEPECENTTTVTIHPNNGNSNFTMENVCIGGTISSISSASVGSWGKVNTPSWYTDEDCTSGHEFTLNSSTVTANMHLYAKWGVSGNYYLAGHLWMANGNGDWSQNNAQQMTNSDGVASFEYTAPAGWNPFEILNTDKGWNYVKTSAYLDTDNSTSGIQLQEKSGHLAFYLNSAKRVRVSYNGKVKVEVLGDHTLNPDVSWSVKTSDSGWGKVPNSWDHSNTMTIQDGVASVVIRNVPANTDHSFMITRGSSYGDEQSKVGTYNFNALYLDTSSPSSGLSWQTTTAKLDNSDNYQVTLAQTDNEWRNCKFRLSQVSDVRITFDGGLIRMDILPKYTVTFMDGETELTALAQNIVEGGHASAPNPTKEGYSSVEWRENGVNTAFDFANTAINADLTLYAFWTPKTLESISLNESSIVMVKGGSNATLTPSYLPTDLIAEQQPTYDWSVSEGGVVTVDGGVITVVGEGTVTVTCTAHGTDKSANCVVTVKDCNTEPTDIFTYTLGSDPTGDAAGSAVMNGMFNEASNTVEPTLQQVNIQLSAETNDHKWIYDNGDETRNVKIDNETDDNKVNDAFKWYVIEVSEGVMALQNVNTKHYLAMSDEVEDNGNVWGRKFATTIESYITNVGLNNDALWKWGSCDENSPRLKVMSTAQNNANYTTGEYTLHCYGMSNNWRPDNTVMVGSQEGCQGNKHLRPFFKNAATVPNPAYLKSPDAGYYRFATGANVVATLNRAIKVNDVIRLEVKNPSKAAVSATVTIGSQVANINLAAGVTRTETITVTDANRPTSITIASDDVNFMLKSVVVNREMPNPGKDPNLAWSDTPSAAHQVADGDISDYIATRSGEGLITYTSSNESIATVAADGTVHPIAEGTVTITATLEQDGCYNGGSTNYSLTLEDLPKPTITITANDEMPQGSYQTVTVSQNGNGALTFGITSGTGATLTNNGEGSYLLALAGNATDIVLTASTERTGQHAQHSVSKNISVQQCYVDGHVIYSYTLSGHDDLNAAEAEGGTYSQADLASVGTDDNPKTVELIKIKFQNDQNRIMVDPAGDNIKFVTSDPGNNTDKWYKIPAGTNAYNNALYYLKNQGSGKYLYCDIAAGYLWTANGGWSFYRPKTGATLPATSVVSGNTRDAYKWFWYPHNGTEQNNLHLTVNQGYANSDATRHVINDEYSAGGTDQIGNPYIRCGKGTDQGHSGLRVVNEVLNASAANPDYFYSVTHDAHEYYILNGGTVTVSRASAFKAGDVITLNVFNRGAAAGSTIKVANNTIATNVNGAAALKYTVAEGDGVQGQNNFVITPLNGYICLNSISIFRPKDEDEFINPTLTWDDDLSAQQMIDMNKSETGMSHAVSVNAPVNEAVVYSVSPAAKADINSATGALTLTNEAQNKDVLTVTATLPAIGCYNQAVASYEIYVKNLATPTLSAAFGTLKQGYASTLTVTTNSDAVPALSSLNGFAVNGDPTVDNGVYTYNIIVSSTAESVSVHVALEETADYLAYAIDAADENVAVSNIADLYDNTPANGTLVLEADYAGELVINKALTINGNGHSIGNLKVENEGDLTLSGALTVNDFTICAKAGNTTTPAASGQVRNATNLTVNGEAYFLYTVDPSGHVQYGWYDFTVPFRVNVMTGIKGIQEGVLNEDFVNERDYAVMEHLGEKQAAGEYAYKKFRGVMEPCRLYSITLDPQNNYNTIRFQKADGDLVADNSVTLNSYSSAVDNKHANWNGVGNGTLHHADAGLSVAIQVYQSGNKTFLPVSPTAYSLVIGSAFMVQQTGTMTLNQATHDKLLAPRRAASVQPTAIQIASEGQPFSDQLFISADEMAGQGYTQGADVAKAGNIGNVNVPQIWTNAYNSKLCAHEAQLINGEASYTLSLYAPANGSYTLTSKNIPEGYTLYLTQNGNRIWDLSERYVLDLTKGTATEYGLLLVERYNAPTAVENIGSKADETQKIMHNGILYILRNGKVFNAQGARVK